MNVWEDGFYREPYNTKTDKTAPRQGQASRRGAAASPVPLFFHIKDAAVGQTQLRDYRKRQKDIV